MRIAFLAVGAMLALSACTTAQLSNVCDKASGFRQAVMTTLAAIDATCPNGAFTSGLEKYCEAAMLVRNAALLSLAQMNAACPVLPITAEQVDVFRQADAASEANEQGELPLPAPADVPENLRW